MVNKTRTKQLIIKQNITVAFYLKKTIGVIDSLIVDWFKRYLFLAGFYPAEQLKKPINIEYMV